MGTEANYTLKITVAGDDQGAQATLRGTASGVLALQQAQARYEAATGDTAAAIGRLTSALSQQDTTTAQTIGAQTQLAQLQNRLAAEQQKAAAEALSHARAEASLAQATGESERAAQILQAALSQQTERTTQVIAAERQLVQIQSEVGASGGALEQIMTGAYRRIGEAAVNLTAQAAQAVGQFIVNSEDAAARYETTMSQIIGLTGTSADAVAHLSQETLNLGPAVGKGPQELGESLYFVLSSGVDAAHAMDVVSVSAKGAAAGLGETKTVADLATSVMNAYGQGNISAAQATDVLVQAVKDGKGEPAAFGAALGRVLPIASAAGVSFQQVAASVATMTRIGLNAEEAVTALRGIIGSLEAPTSKTRDALDSIGLSADDVRASIRDRGLLATLQMLMERTHGNLDVMSALVPNVRALTGVLATAGSQGAAYAAILNDMNHAQGATDAAFQEATKTAAFQEQALGAAMSSLQISIGSVALPAIASFLRDGVIPTVQGFTQFIQATKEGTTWVSQAAGVVQSYGIPAIVGLTAATVAYGIASGAAAIGGIQNLGVALALVGQRALMAIPGIVANGVAVAATVAPYAAIALAIGGVVKAYQYYQDQVSGVTQKVLNSSAIWREGTTVLEEYHKSSQAVQDGARQQATELEILRAKQEELVNAYARYVSVNGNATPEAERQRNAINALGDAITKVTVDLKQHVAALDQAAKSDAIEQTHQLAAAHGQLAQAVRASDEAIDKANKDIVRAQQQGVQALGQATQTTAQFLERQAQDQQAHEQKLLDLKTKYGQAKTAKERESITAQITAENAGFAEQQTAAGVAYAQQEAEQRAHLGRELIDYVQAQAVKNSAFREKADELTSAIADQFGVQTSLADQSFGQMLNDVDAFASGTASDAGAVAEHLGQVADTAATTQQRMDDLAKTYTIQLEEDLANHKITAEEYAKALAAIPAKVRTVVEIEERLKQMGGGGSIGRNYAAGGGRFVTTGPTTLTVGDNPGGRELVTVTPLSGRGQTRVGHNMVALAGGGSILALSAGDGGGDAGDDTDPPPAPVGRARGRRGPDPLKQQQKLNNSLLADQQRADQQLENLEQSHQEKLLKIDADFAKKQLAQQQSNEISKRRSRYDFYKSISDLDVASQQKLSAEYEQAAAEARAMDAAGNKKEAADYLAMRQQQIQDEKEYLSERKRIQEDGSLSKSEKAAQLKHLDDLRAMQQDAEREEMDQLKANGDAIQNEHAQQVADEQAAYAEGQEKIATASEQAADRKIANYNRSRAGVEAENDALREQITLQHPAADASGGGGGGGGGGTPIPGRASGGPVAAGGSYLVGEHGPELVTFGASGNVIPAGETRQLMEQRGGGGDGGGLSGMDLGDSIIRALLSGTRNQKAQISALKQYEAIVEQAAQIVRDIEAIRTQLAAPQALLDPQAVLQLARDTALVTTTLADNLVPATRLQANQLKGYTEMVDLVVGAMKTIADLEKDLTEPRSPIDAAAVQRLTDEAELIAQIVLDNLVTAGRQQMDGLKSFAEVEGATVGILKDVADLGRDLADAPPAISAPLVRRLAEQARAAAQIVLRELGPASQQVADGVKAFQETEGAAVTILKDTADLGRDLKDIPPAISVPLIRRLSGNARTTAEIVAHGLIPASAEVVAGVKAFQETDGAAVSILKDTADLGRDLKDASPAIDAALIRRLSGEARTVANIVAHGLIPMSKAEAEGVKQFAETEGAAVSALKATLDLSGSLFTDYRSPTDAQLDRVVADARRITGRLVVAARVYKKEGLEGAKLFAEALGGTVGAFKDQLLFVDALNAGDFVLSPQKLGQFERATAATMEVARRLGARAASIPSEHLNALARTTTLLKDEAEALIKLAAVPFDDLERAARGLGGLGGLFGGGGGGGGGTQITFAAGAIQVDARGQNNPYEIEAMHRRAADAIYHELAQRLQARR